LLEKHDIGKVFFHAVSSTLEKCGHTMRGGSIVDATLISAPSSTKNEKKERAPEMRQVKKGNERHIWPRPVVNGKKNLGICSDARIDTASALRGSVLMVYALPVPIIFSAWYAVP
jgi:IS5 family transposase